MKHRFFSIISAVIGYVCRRCPQHKQQVEDYDIPDFMYPARDRSAEAGLERDPNPANDAIRIMTADEKLYIFPDGHRLLIPRARK